MKFIHISIALLSFWLLTFCHTLDAQIEGLEFIEDDSLHTDLGYESYNLAFIYLKNNRQDSLFLSWEITSKDLPEEWYVTICDNVACYGVLPDAAEMYGIAPSDSVYIRFEVNPYLKEGYGRVDLKLVETNTSAQVGNSLIFTFLTKNFTNIGQTALDDVSYVYPNPFQDYIIVKNPFTTKASAKIINASGKLVSTIDLNALEEKEMNLISSRDKRLFLIIESESNNRVIPLIKIQ